MFFARFSPEPGLKLLILYSVSGQQVCVPSIGRYAFDATGIKESEKYTSFKPQNLAERTGLAYIPLYSPAQKDRKQRPPRTSTPCDSLQPYNSFSDSEISSSGSKVRRYSPFPGRSLDDTSLSEAFAPLRRPTTVSKYLI